MTPWCSQVSIWVSELTGGPARLTICARTYRCWLHGSRTAGALIHVLDYMFREPGHCRKSYLKRIGDHYASLGKTGPRSSSGEIGKE